MSGILVIESDRKRHASLTTFLREHAHAEVTIVDSVRAAIDGFEKYQPDVILASALLSVEENHRLSSHVRRYAAPHVQMLAIPSLDTLRAPAREEHRGAGFFGRSRPIDLGLQDDRAKVGRQIRESLERARQLREPPTPAAGVQAAIPVGEPTGIIQPPKAASGATASAARERRWAERTPQNSPGLWTVRLPWPGDVDLVNISRTGILLESGSRLTPGATLELQLSGMGTRRVALARFVRSEVARVDRLGVRYYSAAQFEQPLEMPSMRSDQPKQASPQALADLFKTVVSESNQRQSRSTRFALGLRGLIGARDVLIGRAPASPVGDAESIYFTVKGDGESRTILQVTFDRQHEPTATEFALLKAAAGITAAVLELERAFGSDVRAEVA